MQEADQHNRKFGLILGFLGLLLFQLASTVFCFKTPAELFRAAPIINIDWCSQYYWSFAGRQFFAEARRLWGFDPYFMAGYPLDFIFNSSLPVQLANIIFRFLPVGLVIKWCFFLSFLSVPLVFFFALRNFGLGKNASLIGAGLGVSYFWLGEDALFGNWGMIAGAFLLNFFLLAASALYRYLRSGERKRFLVFVICITFAVLLHKTFAVLIGLPGAILVLIFLRRMNARVWLGVLAALVFAYLINSFWLIPFFHFLPNKIEDPNTTFFQNTLPWKFVLDLVPYSFPGVPLGRLAILIPAVYGVLRMRKDPARKDLFRFTVMAGAVFFVLVYFGSFSALLRNVQPYRYLTALFFLLTPAAGLGLAKLFERFSGRVLAKALPLGFGLLLLALQFVPSFRLFYVVAPLTSVWSANVMQLEGWLRDHTDASGRIMMEDINKWQDRLLPYGPSRFVGILPAFLPRYLIGGPLPNAFIKHHYASFHDGLFLNRPIRDYSDRELEKKLALYNIRWAAAWSDSAKARLNKFPPAKKAGTFGQVEVFEIANPSNWFLAGSGELKADYDTIELRELKPANGMVVLKMHWLDGFKPSPACELFRFEVPGDPIGFLGLKNPAPEVLLKYER